jgi:hypothetical protein
MEWLNVFSDLAVDAALLTNEKSLYDTVREALEEECAGCGQRTKYTRSGHDGLPTCPSCLMPM